MSKAEEIRAKNTARMEQGAREKDLAKLNAAIEQGTGAVAKLAVTTPEIQIVQIGTLLKLSIDQKSAVDILDCLWEVEAVFETLDTEGQKKFLSEYRKPFEKAQSLREKRYLGGCKANYFLWASQKFRGVCAGFVQGNTFTR